MTAAPIIEGTINPVLKNQTVKILTKTPESITFDVSFTKTRNCKLESLEWVSIKGNKTYDMIVIDENNRFVRGRPNRESGLHLAGPFIAKLPELSRPPDYINGVAYYKCHSLYFIKQDFGKVFLGHV